MLVRRAAASRGHPQCRRRRRHRRLTGRWVALHLQSHPETGVTLVVARLGECPDDADGHDVPLASRPTAGAALDRALHRLTDGWRHASDEPPAPPASARAAIAHPAPLRADAAVDRGGTRAD